MSAMTPDHLHLALRRRPGNADHHLWNNHGTWWCHFTLKRPSGASIRKRVSLKTADLETARHRRDRILAAMREHSGRIAA